MSDEAAWRRFPFAAIVGQERMKLGLLLNAIDPRVGGVLIRGNKGTAKSTAVRALAALLPPLDVVEGCPFRCAPGDERAACASCSRAPGRAAREVAVPIVELPVGATEDRLTGSLDIEAALQSGAQAFQPGLLAAAHRGILYVDEVNLLSDHLVDVLLDAAAMGRNFVEREGISASHAARFILIGTMNPEEGDLRPQLLDRFGLMVEADDGFAPPERAEVVRRRIAFETGPEAFAGKWATEQEALRARLEEARELLPRVAVPELMLDAITTLCAEQGVDGLRADLVIYRTASALAAWDGRDTVNLDDVREAAKLALAHRRRRQPFEESRMDERSIDDTLSRFEEPPPDAAEGAPPPEDSPPEPGEGAPEDSGGEAPDETSEIGAPVELSLSREAARNRLRQGSSRRTEPASHTRGRAVGSRVPGAAPTSVDFAATLRAAAPHQVRRGLTPGGRLHVRVTDVREKVREGPATRSILFVVDASGSMGAQQRMAATKGAILSLLTLAYQDRERVGMVVFRRTAAEVVLPLTRSVELAHRRLRELPTGGRTPLAEGLRVAREVMAREATEHSGLRLVVLLTDGRANAGASASDPFDEAVNRARELVQAGSALTVIDTETGAIRLGMAARLAGAASAECLTLPAPAPESLLAATQAASRV